MLLCYCLLPLWLLREIMNQDKAAKYAFKCPDISLLDSINDAIKIIYIILHPTSITFISTVYLTLLLARALCNDSCWLELSNVIFTCLPAWLLTVNRSFVALGNVYYYLHSPFIPRSFHIRLINDDFFLCIMFLFTFLFLVLRCSFRFRLDTFVISREKRGNKCQRHLMRKLIFIVWSRLFSSPVCTK